MTVKPGRIPGIRFLHSPGPTHLPDPVLDAMHRQPMDLGDPRVDDLIADLRQGLDTLSQETAPPQRRLRAAG